MRRVRRAALALAVAALLAIGLRPRWSHPATETEAILVTPGADAAAVRHLADSLGGVKVFQEAASVPRLAAPRRIHVVGWGLDPDAWHALDSIAVTFHPSPPAPGFRRASWPATIPLGDELVVEGTAGPHRPETVVALLDAAGVSDSVEPDTSGAFRLATRPRALGRLRYVLRATIGGRPVAQETLGVTVVVPETPRLLVLEASPRFETRALREWLGSRRGAIAVRSLVSRDRFRSEFVNRDSTPLGIITDRLLSQFDLVAVDGRTLAGLGPTERAALRRAVMDRGLGVLIVPDSVVLDSTVGGRFHDREFFLDFTLRPVRGLDERTVRPRWAGVHSRPVGGVPAYPYTLADRFGAESIIDDGAGGVLAQVTPRGSGHIGITLIRESARWIRAGERDAYSAFWARLLSAFSPGPREDRWEIATPGPWLVNRPILLSVAGVGDHGVTTVSAASGASDSVFLARDPLGTGSGPWRGIFWPRVAGWHHVDAPGAPSFYVQATSRTTWLGRRSTDLLDAGSRYLVESGSPRRVGEVTPARASRPIPPAWFFGLFLLCAGVLWSKRRAG